MTMSNAEKIRNVAGIAGVCESSVYKAIHGYADVAVKTKEKFIEISNRLKYDLFDQTKPVIPRFAVDVPEAKKILKTIGENPDPQRYASSLYGWVLKPKQCPYCKNIFTPDTYKQELCTDCKPRKVKKNGNVCDTKNGEVR